MLHREGIADLPSLRTLLGIRQKLPESSFWEVNLFCFISISRFGSFNNPFALITRLSAAGTNKRSDFYNLWLQQKLLKTMEMRLDLIFMMSDIYINFDEDPFTKFSKSSRTTKFKDIIPWYISHMITKSILFSMKIVISCAMKRGIPF